jgi:hypothetical protein
MYYCISTCFPLIGLLISCVWCSVCLSLSLSNNIYLTHTCTDHYSQVTAFQFTVASGVLVWLYTLGMLVVPSVMMMGQSPPNMDTEAMLRTGNRIALLFTYSGKELEGMRECSCDIYIFVNVMNPLFFVMLLASVFFLLYYYYYYYSSFVLSLITFAYSSSPLFLYFFIILSLFSI